LPADSGRQKLLRDATKRILTDPALPKLAGAFFSIERKDFEQCFGAPSITNVSDFIANVVPFSVSVATLPEPSHQNTIASS